MKTNILADCPFCHHLTGSNPWIDHDHRSEYQQDWCFYVKCDCTAQGPKEKTEEEAIKAWNNRAA